MLSENSGIAQAEAGRQEESSGYDFGSCQRLKKLTTHDIYRFSHQGSPLVVKLFAPGALPSYQHELACLRCASHPALLRILHHRPALDASSPDPFERSHLVVMAEARRGDLNDYLPRYGKMEEKVARSFFRQLVEALQGLAELQPPLVHPNLQAASVLLGDDGQVRVCGWSEANGRAAEERAREGVFACGEVLVCMLTAFMPFYKKHSPTDTYFKFLSPEHIHKFWQELQRKVQKTDKKFAFSPEARDLIEGIFLKKLTSLSDLAAHHWTRGEVYGPEELLRLLEENEKARDEKLAAKRQVDAARDEQRRRALHEYQLSFGLNRSGLDAHQEFLKDCEENTVREEELPEGSPLAGVRVEGSAAFVIASLKELLRSEQGQGSAVVCEQLVLARHCETRTGNCLCVELEFAVGEEEEEELLQPEHEQERVALALRISFSRSGKDLFAEVDVEKTHFNAYYTNLARAFIQDRIQKTTAPQ